MDTTTEVQDLFQRALERHQSGHLKDAEQLYNKILQEQPSHGEAIHLLGLIGFQQRDYVKAISLITRAVEIDPGFAAAHYNLGRCYEQVEENEKAIRSYNRSLSLKPDDVDCYLGLGNVLKELKRFDEALESFDRAIALNPKFVEAYNNRGNVLKELERFDEALESCDTAIALDPKFVEAHNNRGNVLKELRRFAEALESCDRAIALNPKFVEAHNNRGIVLQELKHLDEALASYDRAIALNPIFVEAHNNRGNVLKALKHLDEALASYDRAIALESDYAEAHLNKSLCLLLQGEFNEGWKHYDWRWKTKRKKKEEFTSIRPLTDKPTFSLQDRKRVLIWAEQGVGDEIMFASTIEEFGNLCDKLIVQVDGRLIPLFSRSISHDVSFFPKNSVVPQDLYDQQIAMGSIGKYLRNDEASFVRSRFGYLKADSKRTGEIRSSLSNKSHRKICGISWKSKNERSGDRRSLTLNSFLRLLFMKEYEFVSLQYGEIEEELRSTKAELGVEVISCGQVDNLKDLDGLASLIQACDVVVSIDNTTVHLAGALGKDVRILLPDVPDWRWQLDRKDSPWYSSATLYRQGADGDWTSAFNEIRSDLQTQ
jgi:tetratricopeptide (TPR) repeat protein